jgi:hypothetical protein
MNKPNIERPFFPNTKNLNIPILSLPGRFDVYTLLEQIEAHPEIWNRYGARKEVYQHSQMSDIWVRYNDYNNFNGDLAEFNKEHIAVWYPESYKIPAVFGLVDSVFDYVGGKQLGGVLITKIPPKGQVAKHIDSGWHASYYEKFAVQLMGNKRQAFQFEGFSLSALPGELYTFDNSRTHWVTNDSNEDRMTLIICIRR